MDKRNLAPYIFEETCADSYAKADELEAYEVNF
jgi:hypothetical protein